MIDSCEALGEADQTSITQSVFFNHGTLIIVKFTLSFPVIVGLNQLETISLFRDGKTGIRSQEVSHSWDDFKSATINGSLDRHHVYFIVSRNRVRFAGLKSPKNHHFYYDPVTRTSPVEVNFETLSGEQMVMEGVLDLSVKNMADTLLDAFKHRLQIDDLMGIVGEPLARQYVTAASFVFPKEKIKLALSPDLWKFVYFPGCKPGEGPESPCDFDYRVEYIGKSINDAESRLSAHSHVRRVQSGLGSQNHNREAFVVMYQVDFEKLSGAVGVGSRENPIELEAAEAMLIKYFKPRYNERSLDFSLVQKNADNFDEILATKMRLSNDYPPGGTSVCLINPAALEDRLSLFWGRLFTDHRPAPSTVVQFDF